MKVVKNKSGSYVIKLTAAEFPAFEALVARGQIGFDTLATLRNWKREHLPVGARLTKRMAEPDMLIVDVDKGDLPVKAANPGPKRPPPPGFGNRHRA